MTNTDRERGLLIAVEGIDGAGKTTQVRLLADFLRNRGFDVVTSKEPTDGVWGRQIRESAANGRLDPDRELQLFIRDRTEHTNQVIKPALDRGQIVILDRYYYSSIAYQGCRGRDFHAIQQLMESQFPHPDVVFLLDLDPVVSLRRIHVRGDRPNEFERVDDLTRARAVFNSLDDSRVVSIDGSLSIDEVHAAIVASTRPLLEVRACARIEK